MQSITSQQQNIVSLIHICSFFSCILSVEKDRMNADKELFTQQLKLRDKSFDIKTAMRPEPLSDGASVAFDCHFQSLEHVRWYHWRNATGFWLAAFQSDGIFRNFTASATPIKPFLPHLRIYLNPKIFMKHEFSQMFTLYPKFMPEMRAAG